MWENLFSKLENMELEDARSGIDKMVVQAKLKIADICIQILKREDKEFVKTCSVNTAR